MNCLLIEPLTGQILGVLLDIDEIPGPLTWIGVVLIMIAINILSNEKEKKSKAAVEDEAKGGKEETPKEENKKAEGTNVLDAAE